MLMSQDFPGHPVVKSPPTNAGEVGALGTLDATHKVPRNPGLPREEH